MSRKVLLNVKALFVNYRTSTFHELSFDSEGLGYVTFDHAHSGVPLSDQLHFGANLKRRWFQMIIMVFDLAFVSDYPSDLSFRIIIRIFRSDYSLSDYCFGLNRLGLSQTSSLRLSWPSPFELQGQTVRLPGFRYRCGSNCCL